VAKSDIRIGIGRFHSMVESELPIIKNTRGDAIIPGSTMKGLIRNSLNRIFETIRTDQVIVEELFGQSKDNKSKSDDDITHASSIFCHDLIAQKTIIKNRKHVHINPETQGVNNLFDVDCVVEGTIFKGQLLTFRNVPPEYMAIMEPIRHLAADGILRLGGFRSRGYGLFNLFYNKIEIQFIGKNKKDLQDGVSITFNIPIQGEKYLFKLEGSEERPILTIQQEDYKLSIQDIKIQEVPQIFGISIIIEDEKNIKNFIHQCLNSINIKIEKIKIT